MKPGSYQTKSEDNDSTISNDRTMVFSQLLVYEDTHQVTSEKSFSSLTAKTAAPIF